MSAEKNHVGGVNIMMVIKKRIKKFTVFHILLNLKKIIAILILLIMKLKKYLIFICIKNKPFYNLNINPIERYLDKFQKLYKEVT